MPNIEDMSPDEIADFLKSQKARKRYRVREFDLDEEDFRRVFGLVEGDAKPSEEPEQPKQKRGYFSAS